MFTVTYLHVSRQRNIAHINGPGAEGWRSIKRLLWNTGYIFMSLSRWILPKPNVSLICVCVISCFLVCICQCVWLSIPGWPVIFSWTCCGGWQGRPLWSCRCSSPMTAWSSETLWLASSMLPYPARLRLNFRQKLTVSQYPKIISPTKLQ